MIDSELLQKLKIFNLNSYESKIWVALLMKGSASASSLSTLATVPRSRCYDVLENLEKKGFIIMKVGKPIEYSAVAPKEVIETIKKKLIFDAKEKVKTINNVKSSDLMNSLNYLYNSNLIKDSDFINLSIDSINIVDYFSVLKEISNKHNKEVKILTNSDDTEMLNSLKQFAQVKIISNVKNFCVTNEKAALFLTNNQNENESLISISSKYSINMFKDLFNAKWNSN